MELYFDEEAKKGFLPVILAHEDGDLAVQNRGDIQPRDQVTSQNTLNFS